MPLKCVLALKSPLAVAYVRVDQLLATSHGGKIGCQRDSRIMLYRRVIYQVRPIDHQLHYHTISLAGYRQGDHDPCKCPKPDRMILGRKSTPMNRELAVYSLNLCRTPSSSGPLPVVRKLDLGNGKRNPACVALPQPHWHSSGVSATRSTTSRNARHRPTAVFADISVR